MTLAIASVLAHAVDQIVGRRGYLAHDVRPYVGRALVGRASTVLVRPATPEQATPTLAVRHSVEMIDNARPGEVGVIVMEGSLDVAAIGGLMGTAAKARGMAGMVIDGAVRDLEELRELGLPVFARAVSPATAVRRYASVAKQIPVECAGVTVNPGDFVVAGGDGVVIVPQDRAVEILERAQEIDERETKMVPEVEADAGCQLVHGRLERQQAGGLARRPHPFASRHANRNEAMARQPMRRGIQRSGEDRHLLGELLVARRLRPRLWTRTFSTTNWLRARRASAATS